MRRLSLWLALTQLWLVQVIQCIKHQVKLETHIESFSYHNLYGMPMYSVSDTTFALTEGSGKSYIELKDFKIDRIDAEEKYEEATMQLVIIPDPNAGEVVWTDLGEHMFCCTEATIALKGSSKLCKERSQLNTLVSSLYSYENFDGGSYRLIKFWKGQKHVDISDWKYNVKESRIHIFAVATCNASIGIMKLSGNTVWMNPYGHLPPQLYGLLPFYRCMCIVYFIATGVWLLLKFLYWKDILHLQNFITGLFVISLFEMILCFSNLKFLNDNGVHHTILFIGSMITSVTRQTILRMLVVAVCMGYGVVKPNLGDVKYKISMLGLMYWAIAFPFQVFTDYSQTSTVSQPFRTIFIVPVAGLDGYFWYWTFSCLNRTIADLTKQKQDTKLLLYKRFHNCLDFALLFGALLSLCHVFYLWLKLYLRDWNIIWIVEVASWKVLYTLVFFSSAVLWRPSMHASKYAYSQQIATEDRDDTEIFENVPGNPYTAEAVDTGNSENEDADDEFEIGDF